VGQGFAEGAIIEVTGKPEWGPGKIVHASGDHLHIVFRELPDRLAKMFSAGAPTLRLAQSQKDPILDNLPPLIEKNGRWYLPAERVLIADAERRFLRHFPAGFLDPRYVAGERAGKDEAHRQFQMKLPPHEIGKMLESDDLLPLIKTVLSVKTHVNELLAPFENAAFHDAMGDRDAARGYMSALLRLLQSPASDQDAFEYYIDSVMSLPVRKSRVASWPVATLLPHIAQPTRHMFLKPERTRIAAEALGFDLRYEASLNWSTYESLLRMGSIYLDLLKNRGAKDFIDVQSFIFVGGGGYDA
jgi:hypothetical protein